MTIPTFVGATNPTLSAGNTSTSLEYGGIALRGDLLVVVVDLQTPPASGQPTMDVYQTVSTLIASGINATVVTQANGHEVYIFTYLYTADTTGNAIPLFNNWPTSGNRRFWAYLIRPGAGTRWVSAAPQRKYEGVGTAGTTPRWFVSWTAAYTASNEGSFALAALYAGSTATNPSCDMDDGNDGTYELTRDVNLNSSIFMSWSSLYSTNPVGNNTDISWNALRGSATTTEVAAGLWVTILSTYRSPARGNAAAKATAKFKITRRAQARGNAAVRANGYGAKFTGTYRKPARGNAGARAYARGTATHFRPARGNAAAKGTGRGLWRMYRRAQARGNSAAVGWTFLYRTIVTRRTQARANAAAKTVARATARKRRQARGNAALKSSATFVHKKYAKARGNAAAKTTARGLVTRHAQARGNAAVKATAHGRKVLMAQARGNAASKAAATFETGINAGVPLYARFTYTIKIGSNTTSTVMIGVSTSTLKIPATVPTSTVMVGSGLTSTTRSGEGHDSTIIREDIL